MTQDVMWIAGKSQMSLVVLCDLFTHILQGYFTGTRAIIARVPVK